MIPSTELHAVCRVVPGLDFDDLPGLELVTLDEPEELGILVADPLDGHCGVEGTREERVVPGPADRSVLIRDGIAVGVDGRTSEHLVDPVDQALRDGVLQVFGLVVNLGPAHTQHPHKEQFDQPMAPQDERSELFA